MDKKKGVTIQILMMYQQLYMNFTKNPPNLLKIGHRNISILEIIEKCQNLTKKFNYKYINKPRSEIINFGYLI